MSAGTNTSNGIKLLPSVSATVMCKAPFVAAPGNRHESPLLLLALPQVTCIAKHVGIELNKTIVSLDAEMR